MAMLHDQKSLIWCLQMIVQYNNFLLLIYKNVWSCHPSFTKTLMRLHVPEMITEFEFER